jgi:hypothetical protein
LIIPITVCFQPSAFRYVRETLLKKGRLFAASCRAVVTIVEVKERLGRCSSLYTRAELCRVQADGAEVNCGVLIGIVW